MIYYVIPAYIILRDGLFLLTAGDDKQFQLAHPDSFSFFNTIINSEELPVQPFTSRPNPTEILKNREILEIVERTEDENTIFTAKWVEVGIGDTHMLAVSTDGRLYSWGTGIFGQLGLEFKQMKEIQSSLIDFNTKMKKRKQGLIKEFEFSKYNLSTLKEGLEAAKGMYLPSVPHPVKINLPVKVISVACGLHHSIVLDTNGDVYTFGLGDNGRLGHGETKNELLPRQLVFENFMKVKTIAAGYHNSFFINDANEVYSCGAVSSNSSGHSDDTIRPKKVMFLENIYQISSSENHTGAIDYEGKLILFGDNEFNKVGGDSPYEIQSINNKRIRQVRCGGKHTAILTEDFEVYTWGSNRKGQLGLSSTIFQ